MMEEKDLGKRCLELGSLLTSTGRPFTILLRMEGFVFQLESSKFPPPQVLQMAARPYNPLTDHPRSVVEVRSCKAPLKIWVRADLGKTPGGGSPVS